MKISTQLQIAEPCSQDWNGMQPAAHGRFCGSCRKTVIDFTQMDDAQMLATIARAAGGCCGRFAAHQLQRPLVLHPAHRVPFRMPLFPAALLVSGLLLSLPDRLHAQQRTPVATQQVSGSQAPVPSPQILGGVMAYTMLSGRVSNGHRPIAGATVLLANTTRQVTTDAKGNFKLTVPLNDATAHLLVKANGYIYKNIPIQQRYTGKFLEIQLEPMILGKVAAVPATKPAPHTVTPPQAASCLPGAPAMNVKDNPGK